MKTDIFNYQLPDTKYRNKIINELINEYTFLNHGCLSQSLCFRNIDYIQIGNPDCQILLAGGFHGMEWLTSLLLIHFIKNISEAVKKRISISDINISDFLRYRGILVIPCVNPDGVEISMHGAKSAGRFCELVEIASNGDTDSWQANARGVDINHNFDAGWEDLHNLELSNGIIGPAKTQYGGPYPESEPESSCLTKLCKTVNIKHALAFHSQGEEIYWHYGKNTPRKSELMARILAMSSGYTATYPAGLAVGGGFKDWFIDKLKRPAFTVEIGKGKNPLPLSDLEKIYNDLEELLVLSLIM